MQGDPFNIITSRAYKYKELYIKMQYATGWPLLRLFCYMHNNFATGPLRSEFLIRL